MQGICLTGAIGCEGLGCCSEPQHSASCCLLARAPGEGSDGPPVRARGRAMHDCERRQHHLEAAASVKDRGCSEGGLGR